MQTARMPRTFPCATLKSTRYISQGAPKLTSERPRACSLGPLRPARVVASSGLAHPHEEQEGSLPTNQLVIPTTAMGKGLGSRGSGATMERSKLSLKQEVRQTAPKLDDGMGGGGIGKGIFNGGGGDGGDDDDDDYFNDGEDDGEGDGDGFFRRVFQELYDARAIEAVLQEWYRTMGDLPGILRQAAQMGLFSSAALVRFMSMDVRPNVTRAVTRILPPAASRGVVGRLMADPAFFQKLFLEQCITISASLAYEAAARGDKFWSELDLVAINTLSLAAANAAVVCLVAPTRAAPAPARFEWQNMLSKLPNNIFEGTTPLRSYSTSSRVAAFFVKGAELCGVGMAAGLFQSAAGSAAVSLRQRNNADWKPSVNPPSAKAGALGLAATCGIFANARYQVIAGFDRYLFEHANFLWSYLALSGLLRTASTFIGEQTRVYLQGLPTVQQIEAKRQAERAAQRRKMLEEYRKYGYVTKKKKATGKRRSAGFEMGVGAPAMA